VEQQCQLEEQHGMKEQQQQPCNNDAQLRPHQHGYSAWQYPYALGFRTFPGEDSQVIVFHEKMKSH
jgi:hypothetical protein